MSPLRATFAALALAAAVLLPGVGRAQTCSFSAGPTLMSFGVYDPGATGTNDTTGTFSYSCSSARARPVLIWLSSGNSGSFNPRRMSNGADTLDYNLYSDSQRTAVWGNDTGGYAGISSVPQGKDHGDTLTIYGRIGTGLWVSPGSYTDSITVTLNF
jgi:spore coat protein U-like protein